MEKIYYRPEIDGLRAIAVISVIIYHAHVAVLGLNPFQGGFIGVDIFFVISGYLITSIILKELITTGSFSLKYFYERRVRRILPALLMVMTVSVPFAWIYLMPGSLISFSKTILYSLGFSSNFYFHYSGLEYGAESGLVQPFLHTWSLSVEEQYYILFPIVLLITFKYFRKYLIYILCLGFITSLGLADWQSRNHPSISFYFFHTRAWELLAGSILAYFEITLGCRSKNKILNLILPSLGLILIGGSILFFDDRMFHPSIYTLLPVIGVCLIIWFSQKNEIVTKLLSTKLFVNVGLISYSLYLWHYPVFAFVRYYDQHWVFSEKYLLIFKISSFFAIIFLSVFSYFFIEKVFRNKKFSFKKLFPLLGFILISLISFNSYIVFSDTAKMKSHPFLHEWKYTGEHNNFKRRYNFDNFNNRKNVFIIGNSYSDDLLNVFFYNDILTKKYFFYSTSKIVNKTFQVHCTLKIIKTNADDCEKTIFSSIKNQYAKANYLILANRENEFYFSKGFYDLIKEFKKDNKKFIVFLNDINHADILDRFVLKYNKTPSLDELKDLEKKVYIMASRGDKEQMELIKKKFKENNILYLLRSEIYCDKFSKSCPLIINNDKIYSDRGHITANGAKYFSKKIPKIIYLLNN